MTLEQCLIRWSKDNHLYHKTVSSLKFIKRCCVKGGYNPALTRPLIGTSIFREFEYQIYNDYFNKIHRKSKIKYRYFDNVHDIEVDGVYCELNIDIVKCKIIDGFRNEVFIFFDNIIEIDGKRVDLKNAWHFKKDY